MSVFYWGEGVADVYQRIHRFWGVRIGDTRFGVWRLQRWTTEELERVRENAKEFDEVFGLCAGEEE